MYCSLIVNQSFRAEPYHLQYEKPLRNSLVNCLTFFSKGGSIPLFLILSIPSTKLKNLPIRLPIPMPIHISILSNIYPYMNISCVKFIAQIT